jgi:hypothetical protein
MAELCPRATLDDGWSGDATVESATVVFDREGPSHVLAAVRPLGTGHEARGWGTATDTALIESALTVGLAGTRVVRTSAGGIE